MVGTTLPEMPVEGKMTTAAGRKRSIRRRLQRWRVTLYNTLIDLKRPTKRVHPSDLKELDEIKARAMKRTGMCDHLVTLFIEALSLSPQLIVELGVRKGDSTYVLERVARLCHATLVSVDVEDCSRLSSYPGWRFVHSDDIAFAHTFTTWCRGYDIEPLIDVLFVDTSHLYEHTVQEIHAWFPFLSAKAKVCFHDTNLKEIYARKDGSIGRAWNNERGVIRALEDYFETSFPEEEAFIDFRKGWLIKHEPRSLGFTVLERATGFATP
jgi:cephalosporin hydroxylase